MTIAVSLFIGALALTAMFICCGFYADRTQKLDRNEV